MSYDLILVRVPPGASDEDVERIARAATDPELDRRHGPPDPDAEAQKRALAKALLDACPELEGGEPDYAGLARSNSTSEEEARRQFPWWRISGPDEGAGIEITLYDTYVSVEMASSGGTDQDWEDVWRYLEILVREGGFAVWDPQGPNVVDLAAGPRGDGKRPKRRKRRERRVDADGDEEPEDARRGGEIGKLINRIVNDAIAAPLAAARFQRSGRTWRRHLDDGVIQVVNVQWSTRNGGVEGWFTLNAGVYFPTLTESIGDFPVTKSPKEYDCHVRKRPLPAGCDGWRVRVPGIAKPDPDVPGLFGRFFGWLDERADRKAGDQHERATRELRESVEARAFPWFERVSTLRGARDELLQRGPGLWAAHVSLLMGEREAAARIVEQELAKAKSNPEYSDLVRSWARKHGLIA